MKILKNYLSRILVIFSLGAITGCISTPSLPEKGSRFEPYSHKDKTKALIHLYRNSNNLAGDVSSVLINGKEVSRLPYRGFSRLAVLPGCYRFTQKWPEYRRNVVETGEQEICLEAGESYYLKINPVVTDWSSYAFGTIFFYQSKLEIMEREKAIKEMRDTFFYDLKNLKTGKM